MKQALSKGAIAPQHTYIMGDHLVLLNVSLSTSCQLQVGEKKVRHATERVTLIFSFLNICYEHTKINRMEPLIIVDNSSTLT